MLRFSFLSIVLGAGLLMAAPYPAAQQTASQQKPEEHAIATVTGIDGATYEAYQPAAIRDVQQALKTKGLYQGAVTGVLDETTMKSIAEFQKQNHLEQNGVPSPETRQALLGHE